MCPPPGENAPDTEAASAADVVLEGPEDAVLRIQLDQFEGPFDVLLYLIRQQELDIFDIPIVQVTEQYLRFLEAMREENLDVAGDFLVMAATLIQIKARMILPSEVEEDEEDDLEEEDPRLELVEKLLEYRRYRDLARQLGALEEQRDGWFGRMVKPKVEVIEDEQDMADVGLYDLLGAVRGVLRYVVDPPVHEVYGEGHTVDEKIALLEDWLERAASVSWTELSAASRSRVEMVCCLLAILELCRMHRARVHQAQAYAEIRLVGVEPEAAHAGHGPEDD